MTTGVLDGTDSSGKTGQSEKFVARQLMFIDDEPFVLNALKRLMHGEAEFTCHFAEGPARALEIIRDYPIEVVVSDHRMPQMEGAEFIARLKEKRPNIICIMLTGQANLKDVEKAVNDGDIFKFVLKPWNDGELKELITGAFREYDKKQMLRTSVDSKRAKRLADENLRLKGSYDERTRQLIDALETARSANRKILNGLYSVARSFSNVLELARPDVGSHARKISAIVTELAALNSFTPQAITELQTAALLQDIGTIGLPTYLLERPRESFNENERRAFETHPMAGYETFKELEGFEKIAEFIAKHHERYNGTGFPLKLSGADIPLQAYLIGIADEYVRRMSRLSADEVKQFERVYQDISGMADEQFPRLVVENMLTLMDNLRLRGTTEQVRQVGINDLAPGMIIARNIYTLSGTLLAASETQLDHRKILRMRSIDKVDTITGKILIKA